MSVKFTVEEMALFDKVLAGFTSEPSIPFQKDVDWNAELERLVWDFDLKRILNIPYPSG